ncbi:MAG: hypothetical protein H3C30_18775 [Candidatus Hydrogenedentes bacterium]|nr:hypothetical protein [Candidatus Hydrogenedentota bacterium]
MADRTGTLWENAQDNASLNHGFASHAAVTFYRDVLGLRRVDAVNRRLEVRFSDLSMPSCAGTIPVGAETISLSWRREGNRVLYRLKTPEGWKVVSVR